MDVSYVNPFINATLTWVKNMVGVEAKTLAPQLKRPPFPHYDISGVIGLSGGAAGSISFGFPMQSAVAIVSKMIQAPIKEDDADLIDAIGEIVNIVAGFAKRDLTHLNLSISLPNVILSNHILAGLSGAPTIVVPFTCPLGSFAMEVSLKTN
ncbi:MAG: chemotaxis protein CheX [Chitinispirillales bacterium]|jgi:chemotaxis protein CheX|nr:chemotaxis protein CheX [Chitinispirillales bacterium]